MSDLTDILNTPMPEPLPREIKPSRDKTVKDKRLDFVSGPATANIEGPTPTQELLANNEAVDKRRAQEEATPFIQVMKDKFMTEIALGTIARRNYISSVASDEKPDPNFRVTPEMLVNHTARDQEWLASSPTRKDYDMRIWDLADWEQQQKDSNIKGEVVGFAASMLAGLPEGVISGVGAARGMAALGIGATRLAAAGRQGAALASTLAENVGGNLGMLAVQSAYDTHVTTADIPFAIAFGGVASLFSIPGIKQEASAAHTIKHLEDIQNKAVAEGLEKHERAAATLGEGATPDQIKAEVSRVEMEELRRTTQPGELPPERQILPVDDTNNRVDVPQEEPKTTVEAPAPQPEVKSENPTPPKAPTYTLPKALAGAKPRWKTYDINFASDVDKALFIVSQEKKSKADAAYRSWLKAQGLTDEDIAKYGKKIRDNLKAAEAGTDGVSMDVPVSHTMDTGTSKYGISSIDELDMWYGERLAGQGAMSPLRDRYAYPAVLQANLVAKNTPETSANISKMTGGRLANGDALFALPAGLHVNPALVTNIEGRSAVQTVKALMRFLPEGSRVFLSEGQIKPSVEGARGERGAILSLGNSHVISLNAAEHGWAQMQRTVIHEFGHAIWHTYASKLPASMRSTIEKGFIQFVQETAEQNPNAATRRFSVTSPDARTMTAAGKRLGFRDYGVKFDEYTAEQFVKWIEKHVEVGDIKLSLTKKIIDDIKLMVKAAVNFFVNAGKAEQASKLQTVGEGMEEFFMAAFHGELTRTVSPAMQGLSDVPGLVPNKPSFDMASDARSIATNPTAIAHGIHLRPLGTVTEQAEAKAMVHLYTRADEAATRTMPDEARLSKMMDTSLFSGGQSTANVMARSNNTLVRWIASELLESPGGAQGRRETAALSRHLNEKAYLGNTMNEVQSAYDSFRKGQGVWVGEDYMGGKTWERFNKMVAAEIESRKPGALQVQSPAEVKAAADSLGQAYDRMRAAQVGAKTVGWAALPESSAGYMPHRMSQEKIINMTMAQKEGLHSALTDQFISIEGWDPTFADHLASQYIAQVERRALGGFDAPVGLHQTGAADIVEDALKAMGMSKDEVKSQMSRLMQAGPGYTKKRIRLDLNQQHTLSDGTTFQLMDLFDTDQFSLLRSQAGRVSGEVALARHGVYGKANLALIREAMTMGDNTSRATARELKAFDQIAAEFLNEPFGSQNKWVDRIMQYNSLARLGGMGWTQAAESINGMVSVGVARAFASIGSMGRMRKEILALAKGEKINNPLLTSIENFSGAEFGTDAYKLVFPFDNGSLQHQTYGADTMTMGDRLLRGGAHAQGKLSFWRAFHSIQQRGMAEQIVRKSLEFIREGKNDVALRDMGISDELAGKIRAELSTTATFNGSRVEAFDITKMADTGAANEYVQAIHRGVSQIIQETFIGEKGAWAHQPIARLATQFRTFSITSVEKQWARQRGNVGTAKSLGIIMGAMAMAAPLYIARTYAQSVGRKDQQAYLEQRLSYYNIARATMNYVAATGLAGDFLDVGAVISGADFTGNARGGQGGKGASKFVGNVVAPALSTVDDVWSAIQNNKDGTDPMELVKTLPGSRLPALLPAINYLGN